MPDVKEVFIVCKMMEAEARAALEETGSRAEVVWLELGLHNRPKILHDALREQIARAEAELAPERILLGYGFCGNAVQGLKTERCQLVLPRIDDCITLFIGSRRRKAELEGGVGTLFQTSGWDGDETPLEQHRRLFEEYDEEDAQDLWQMLYGHYGRIGLLDTHCYELASVLESSRKTAELLGFEHCVYDASNRFLRELLSGGPWDERRFIVKAPGEAVTGDDLHAE